MFTGGAVSSLEDYLSAVADAKSRLGLASVPATPWYLGQPDLKGNLVPAFYKSGIDPELEREVLRDYRQSSAEFAPVKGASDADILIASHVNGLPSRIIDWSGNPLAALFLAVESLSADAGRIWVLNPWMMNELTAHLWFVPHTDSDYFKKYVVNLDNADGATRPEAIQPMAFRPFRTTRNYSLQNIYWTVHGRNPAPLNELSFFMKRADVFIATIHIAGEAKKTLLKELHDIGVTRANLFPSLASLTRTLAYRYSGNYIKA